MSDLELDPFGLHAYQQLAQLLGDQNPGLWAQLSAAKAKQFLCMAPVSPVPALPLHV
jgi:hypothetical protein